MSKVKKGAKFPPAKVDVEKFNNNFDMICKCSVGKKYCKLHKDEETEKPKEKADE